MSSSSIRRLRATRSAVATTVALTLAASLAQVPAAAAPTTGARAVAAAGENDVSRAAPDTKDPLIGRGRGATPRRVPADTDANGSVRKVVWPKAGRASAQVSGKKSRFTRAGTGVVSVADPRGAIANDLGLTLAGQDAAPAAVTVQTASQAAADAAGVAGVIGQVQTSAEGIGPVAVKVDYSGFADAYGGDWATRLRLVSLPACALSTPELAECRVQTPVPSTNDAIDQTVTGVLGLNDTTGPTTEPVTPDPALQEPAPVEPAPALTAPAAPAPGAPSAEPTPANPTSGADRAPDADPAAETVPPATGAPVSGRESDPAVPNASGSDTGVRDQGAVVRTALAAATTAGGALIFAVTDGPSGAHGNWSATPMTASATWNAGGSTGEATWSHPLGVPPVPGSLSPSLAISYNSGTVDGRTSSRNNQASWVGEGFGLADAHITRRYEPCAQDENPVGSQIANNAGRRTGDLCWTKENASLTFGGGGGELVKIGDSEGTQLWRKVFDDGTRIQHRTGADNGEGGGTDDTGEYWIVTTTDGTRYYFGLGRAGGKDAGEHTESTWTVPVFGNHAGEPGHDSAFGSSWKAQGWKWNLDRVVDPSGNAVIYDYTPETNKYARNSTAADLGEATVYTRGGWLSRIDYGVREGAEDTAPVARVRFGVAERCLAQAADDCAENEIADHGGRWADVPGDQLCDAAPCTDQLAPTFFTRKRLTTITTEVRTNDGANPYSAVDAWTLDHRFPDPSDGSRPTLWLESIAHTGKAGDGADISLPAINFNAVWLDNRVDGDDNAQPLKRPRVGIISSESGKKTMFTYSGERCGGSASLPGCGTPDAEQCAIGNDDTSSADDRLPSSARNNDMLCFPVYYTAPGQTEPDADPHYFHKYVVDSVTETDLSDGDTAPVVTSYTYLGDPAWAWTTDDFVQTKYRTWDSWRGYNRVRTTVGTDALGDKRLQSETLYYRGLHGTRDNPRTEDTYSAATETVSPSTGDAETDHWRFAGMALETITRNGPAGTQLGSVITRRWHTDEAGNPRPAEKALLAGVKTTTTEVPLGAGGTRITTVITTVDEYGMPKTVEDRAGAAGDLCTFIEYARNESTWMMDRVAQTRTIEGRCDAGITTANTESRTRYFYDDADLGAAPENVVPTKGRATATQTLLSYSGSTPLWSTVSTSYDEFGRVRTVTDTPSAQAPRTTETSYTHAAVDGEGPVTAITVTGPDPDAAGSGLASHETSTDLDPHRGAPTMVTDPTGVATRARYDALGRLVGVWDNNRPESVDADISYDYTVHSGRGSDTGPNAVVTRTRLDDELGQRTLTASTLYDGMLRPRQSQSEAKVGPGTPIPGRIVTATIYDSRGLAIEDHGTTFTIGEVSTELWKRTSATQTPGATYTAYDGAGRVSSVRFDKVTYPNGPTQDGVISPAWKSATTYSGADTIVVDPPTGAIKTTTVHDARGRVSTLTQHGGAGGVTTYDYTPLGQLAKMTDPVGSIWIYSYDKAGRKTAAVDPDAGTSSYRYDGAGQLIETTDGRGKVLATTYDGMGRRTALSEVTGGAQVARSAWAYDQVPGGPAVPGLATSSTRSLTAGAASANLVTKITAVDSLGRPTATRTEVPELAGLIEPELKGNYDTTVAYNNDGSIRTSLLGAYGPAAAELLTHHYDGAGAPFALTGNGSYVADVIRSPLGEVLRYGFGNTWKKASWQTLRYEEGTRRLLETRLDREDATSTDEVLSYSYDDAGNPTKISSNAPGTTTDQTRCYRYDALRQLDGAWTQAGTGATCADSANVATIGGPDQFALTWAFDGAGNRKEQTSRTTNGTAGATGAPVTTSTSTYYPWKAGVSQEGHQLKDVTHKLNGATVGVDRFGYDLAGNTSDRDIAAGSPAAQGGTAADQWLGWDAEGKLDQIKVGSAAGALIETNAYDSDGSRLVRRTATTTTLFLGDLEVTLDRTKATTDPARFAWKRHYNFDGKTIAVRDGNAMTDVQVLISDPHNTASWAIETKDNTMMSRRTLPYGQTLGTQTAGWASSRGFVGGTLDAASGLTLIGARHYDGAAGRFISVDPLIDVADPQQVHGYGYANNNPMAYSDPTGLMPCTSCYGDTPTSGGVGGGGTVGNGAGSTPDVFDRVGCRGYCIDGKSAPPPVAVARPVDTSKPFAGTTAAIGAVLSATDPFERGLDCLDGQIVTGCAAAGALFAATAIPYIGAANTGKGAFRQGAKLIGKLFGLGGGAKAAAETVLATQAKALLGNADDVVVLGRQADTAAAKGWSGHVVLDTPKWSPELNDAFIRGAIDQGRRVYLASPTKGNLVQTAGPFAGQPTIYARELQMLREAGYTRAGNYMVPR